MYRHYVEITAEPYDGDLHFIVNKVFNRLHGIISEHGLNLGLAFPDIGPVSPGKTIRVFGEPDLLGDVRKNSGIEQLSGRRMIHVFAVMEVPANAGIISYLRCRRSEKVTQGMLARKIRRLRIRSIDRGEVWTDELESQIRARLLKRALNTKSDPYLLVERNGGVLPLFIKRSFPEKQSRQTIPCFNRYGLGNGADGKVSTVFDF